MCGCPGPPAICQGEETRDLVASPGIFENQAHQVHRVHTVTLGRRSADTGVFSVHARDTYRVLVIKLVQLVALLLSFRSALGLALALTRLDDLAYKGVVAQDLAQLLIAACQ